jgi:serine/threonine-protein kinase
MDPHRWETIQAVFDELVALDAATRVTRLKALGTTDPEVRAAVESLLAADAEADARLASVESLLSPAPAGPQRPVPASPLPDWFGLTGRTVSHFRVLEPLGAGGMGVVYRAEDTRLARPVALKFLLPPNSLDPAAKERFLHEARSAAALDHPNLCTIHEVGEREDGRLFLAMALYPGETLKARLARAGPLPVGEALEVGKQIAQGLACAHAAGIVHRDLKPGNVMLLPDGTVKILDFGLAKARDQSLSASSARLGTVSYMAPEQIRGEAVDVRADLWALGVVLYEMLTGRQPFRGEDERAVLYSVVHHEPEAVGGLRPDVPEEVTRVLERTLRKDPTTRYRDAGEVLVDLHALQKVPDVGARPAKPLRRIPQNWRGWAGVTALALAASVLGAVLWRQGSSPKETAARPSSIAVLPVANLAGNAEQDPIADGMTDLLINYLSRISGFDRVVSRTSVMPYKRTQKSLRQIGRELGVDVLVEASVLHEGDRVRLNVSLIDAATEQRRWSDSFERPVRNVLALQRDLAQVIAREVAVALTPEEVVRLRQAAPSIDPTAFSLYLQATRSPWRNLSELRQKVAYLEQAIALDSGFAAAYVALAIHSAVDLTDYARAEEVVQRALALDPYLPSAHVAHALVQQWGHSDWAGAAAALRRALDLAPLDARSHHELAMLLMRLGRFDEALAAEQRALYLDPPSSHYQQSLGEVYLLGRRYDEAIREFEKTLRMDPERSETYSGRNETYWFLGTAYLYKRQYDVAARWFEQAGPIPPYVYPALGQRARALAARDSILALAERGERHAARLRPSERKAAGYVAADLVRLLISLGEYEQALDWLERIVDEHLGWVPVYLKVLPDLDPLRGEPRFQALLEKVGLDLGSEPLR